MILCIIPTFTHPAEYMLSNFSHQSSLRENRDLANTKVCYLVLLRISGKAVAHQIQSKMSKKKKKKSVVLQNMLNSLF